MILIESKSHKNSFSSAKQLPPKNPPKQPRFDSYFSVNPHQQFSIIATKNMNTLVKNNIWQGKKGKEKVVQNTSRHTSSISFGNALFDRLTIKQNWTDEKAGKSDKKGITPDTIFNYNTSSYNSSNIIKMLRVKQDVVKDPRLGLSKEQLLTRLITMEQEYKNLKSTFEFRRNQQYLSWKQIKDYKDLIDSSCTQMDEYVGKAHNSNMAIQQLWRMMYSSVDFYKEILDVAKEQTKITHSYGSQNIVYSIVERIEGFLSNSEFNLSKFESIMYQNTQFVEECSNKIADLK